MCSLRIIFKSAFEFSFSDLKDKRLNRTISKNLNQVSVIVFDSDYLVKFSLIEQKNTSHSPHSPSLSNKGTKSRDEENHIIYFLKNSDGEISMVR